MLPLKQPLGLLFHVSGQAVTFLDTGLGLGLAQQGLCPPDLPVHCCLQLPLIPQELIQPRLVLAPDGDSQLELHRLQPALQFLHAPSQTQGLGQNASVKRRGQELYPAHSTTQPHLTGLL